eukprot:GHVR01043255.1.p1 GENE.GHVR01043255.1~~GHVR01043255.1.p1  ORF type:complete len:102 (-),score=4.42 GHVR01043255.1:282-587(-)
MERRRDRTETLEQMKILNLHSRLMKNQHNMIKEALHYGLNEVIGKYGSIVSAIKSDLVPFTMGLDSPDRKVSLFKSDYDLRKFIKFQAKKYAKWYAEKLGV